MNCHHGLMLVTNAVRHANEPNKNNHKCKKGPECDHRGSASPSTSLKLALNQITLLLYCTILASVT